MGYNYKQLDGSNVAEMKQLLEVFAEAFNDKESYQSNVPTDSYLESLLSKEHFIALVACAEDTVIGGLAAYVLEKFEQERKEIYIYDLAVLESHRRKGVATGLIGTLKAIAQERNAYVIYVQADHGDEPAIQLYEKLGTKEDVYHFDIPVI